MTPTAEPVETRPALTIKALMKKHAAKIAPVVFVRPKSFLTFTHTPTPSHPHAHMYVQANTHTHTHTHKHTLAQLDLFLGNNGELEGGEVSGGKVTGVLAEGLADVARWHAPEDGRVFDDVGEGGDILALAALAIVEQLSHACPPHLQDPCSQGRARRTGPRYAHVQWSMCVSGVRC